MNEGIENAFMHHPPKEGQSEKYEAIRKHAKVFAYLIDELCPDSPESEQAVYNLQQAMFWANASIARHEPDSHKIQIPRDKLKQQKATKRNFE